MRLRDFGKKAKRALARNSILFCSWLIARLPFFLIRGFLQFFLSVMFTFTVRLRRIARESLRIAFGPEMPEQRIEQIIQGCFTTIRQGIIELMYYSRFPGRVTRVVTVEGRGHLDAALRQGKGAICVTAHFGNFPLMMLALSQMGYPVSVIMRHTRDHKVAAEIRRVMDRVGVQTIYTKPQRECVTASLKTLRENGVLFVLLDQHFGADGGVYVDFFGRKAATAIGPLVFSSRSGAPILPTFVIRQADGQHKIFVEPEVVLEKRETEEETNFVNISRITNIIEQYIRRYPHEWGWMHRRWKS